MATELTISTCTWSRRPELESEAGRRSQDGEREGRNLLDRTPAAPPGGPYKAERERERDEDCDWGFDGRGTPSSASPPPLLTGAHCFPR